MLPAIYPNAVKADGSFDYAAVSVELADCDGTKSAVLHSAVVTEPGTRYQFQGEVETPMREFKPRLAKCSSEGEWVVLLAPAPINDKGYEVKVRSEKGVTLN